MELSLIIPAYNEAQCVTAAIETAATALSRLTADFEVIVVDDGSLDGTGAKAQTLAADNPCGRRTAVQVLTHPQRRGKGAAVQTGMLQARGKCRFFMDADLSYPPEQLELLWCPLDQPSRGKEDYC